MNNEEVRPCRVSSGGRIKYRSKTGGKKVFVFIPFFSLSLFYTTGQEFIIQNPDRRDSPPHSQLISETINSPIKPLLSLELYNCVYIHSTVPSLPLSIL